MLDLLKDFCNCFLLWIKKRPKWAHNVLQVLETCQVCYIILLIAFEFIFDFLSP